jgi:hypothetical protein
VDSVAREAKPFTAFRFGPGLLAKGFAPKSISLRAFVATQVAIDAEPMFRFLAGIDPLHAHLHTWAGAVAASFFAVALYGLLARREGWPFMLRQAI